MADTIRIPPESYVTTREQGTHVPRLQRWLLDIIVKTNSVRYNYYMG